MYNEKYTNYIIFSEGKKKKKSNLAVISNTVVRVWPVYFSTENQYKMEYTSGRYLTCLWPKCTSTKPYTKPYIHARRHSCTGGYVWAVLKRRKRQRKGIVDQWPLVIYSLGQTECTRMACQSVEKRIIFFSLKCMFFKKTRRPPSPPPSRSRVFWYVLERWIWSIVWFGMYMGKSSCC